MSGRLLSAGLAILIALSSGLTVGDTAQARVMSPAQVPVSMTSYLSASQIRLAQKGKRIYQRLKRLPSFMRKRAASRLNSREKAALRAYLRARFEDSSGINRPRRRTGFQSTAQVDSSTQARCQSWDRTESAVNALGWTLWDFTLTIYWCVNAERTKVYNTHYKVDPDVHALMITYKEISVGEKNGDGSIYDVTATGEFQTCIGFQGIGCFQSRYPHIHIHVEAKTNNYYDQGQ